MRRTIAIVAVVTSMLMAIAIAAVLLVESSSAKTTVWVANGNLPAGARLDGATIRPVQMASGADSFTVLATSPSGKQLAHAVQAGDVLRPDDLVSTTMVQVPVSFKLAPGLAVNDVVDIYAVGGASADPSINAAQGTRLIARHVTIASVGNPSVITVSAAQEPLWVTITSSSVTLIATRSDGVNVPSGTHSYSSDEAVNLLTQLAASGTDSAVSGPAPSPSPSGGQ